MNTLEFNYHKFIYDDRELKMFFDLILQPLKPLEVYFISLSARKKYLTEKERKKLDLGRTEMMCRQIIRENNYKIFLRTLRKYECHKKGYTTKNNSPIPAKCMVVYININPSNVILALNDFNKVINNYNLEFNNCIVNSREVTNICNQMTKINHNLMTALQHNRGTKHWIDIDFDIPKLKIGIVEKMLVELKNKKVIYCLVETKSGFHLMLKTSTINFNYHELIEEARGQLIKDGVPSEDFEIVPNNNEMISIPGTFHAGFKVKILDHNLKKLN